MCPVRRGRNEGEVSSCLQEGHLLLVVGTGDLPGPAFLIQKLTHVITAFYPRKPSTDVSVIPGQKEENACFPRHSADLVCLGLTPAKIYPALPLS